MNDKEFDLSEKIDAWLERQGVCINSLQKSNLRQYVREAVRLLKELIQDECFYVSDKGRYWLHTNKIIDKIFGGKLI